jgi:hypothetical protein
MCATRAEPTAPASRGYAGCSGHPTIAKWSKLFVLQDLLLHLIEKNTSTWSEVNSVRAALRVYFDKEPGAQMVCSNHTLVQEVLDAIRAQNLEDGEDALSKILLGAPTEMEEDQKTAWINTHIARLDAVISRETDKINLHINVMKTAADEAEVELCYYQSIQDLVIKVNKWAQTK